jgi:hypothetical protein
LRDVDALARSAARRTADEAAQTPRPAAGPGRDDQVPLAVRRAVSKASQQPLSERARRIIARETEAGFAYVGRDDQGRLMFRAGARR